MKLNKQFWQVTAIIVVTMLVINPELYMLGLFIDAIGLDIFFMLVQVQIVAIASYFIKRRITPLIVAINNSLMKIDPGYFVPTKSVVLQYPPIIFHVIPGLVLFYWVFVVGIT